MAAWLSIQPDFTPPTPTAKNVFDAYPGFRDSLNKAKANSLGVLTWPTIIETAQIVVSQMPSD